METISTRYSRFASACCFAMTLTLSGGSSIANEETPTIYPETKRGAVVDEQFGTAIADPYR